MRTLTGPWQCKAAWRPALGSIPATPIATSANKQGVGMQAQPLRCMQASHLAVPIGLLDTSPAAHLLQQLVLTLRVQLQHNHSGRDALDERHHVLHSLHGVHSMAAVL